MTAHENSEILKLFRSVASTQYWLRLSRQSGFQRRGIYCLAVVVWMMIRQRWQANGTLADAVTPLRAGGYRRLLPRCKRVRAGRISAATGGYCQARQKLSKLGVIAIVDEFFGRLQAVLREGWPGLQRPGLSAGWLDAVVGGRRGIARPLSAGPESARAIALAGAPSGAEATSEQKLIEEVLARRPDRAMLRTELVPWLDAHAPVSEAYRQWLAEDERQPRFNTDAVDGHGSGW
jgi:hypothetical protein